MFLKSAKHQQGSLIITSLFILIVLLLLGLALNRVLTASTDALRNEIQGLRALNAARSGVEEIVSSVFDATNGATLGTCSTVNRTFSNVGGLEGCRFEASCNLVSFPTDGLDYYQFSSVGICTIDGETVSRRLSIDARVGGS